MLNFYTTVAKNTKGGRIWIEGEALRNAGFAPNKRYRVKYDENHLELRLSNKGERNVSKRTRFQEVFPIIDINNQRVLEIFEEDTPIVCHVERGVIRISIHKIRELKEKREAQYLEKLKQGAPLNESALFVGGGISAHAIHQGLKESGVKSNIDTIAELESAYLQIAQRNLGPVYSIKSRIEDIETRFIRNSDILSFSMPCTGHSTQGKTSNKIKCAEEHKDANTAIFGVVNYIVHSNPAIMISENVIQAKTSATYILLKAELNRLGYDIFEYDLDEKMAGSIEKRRRYWFVAVSKGLNKLSRFDKISIPMFEKQYKTVSNVLKARKDEKWMAESYFDKRLKKNKESGRNFAPSFVTSSDSQTNVIPRNYTKRQISNPHYHDAKSGKIRLFNPIEHARLKGIPSKLIKNVTDTRAHEILGQSILYNHARGIAQMIGTHAKELLGLSN